VADRSRALRRALTALTAVAVVDGSSCTTWVHGIDVSNNQGPIDWAQVPSSGVAFAYIKISEGTWYADPYRVANAIGAVQAGVPWGGYDFARPGSADPAAEADFFIDHGGNNGLPGALDLETTGGLSAADVGAWATAWAVRYVERTGRAPLLYVGAFFPADVSGLARYLPLWLPSYTAGYSPDPNPCSMRQPSVPSAWDAWGVWQFTSSANVNGISGRVDANVMTPALYAALTGVGTAPAPTPSPTVDAPWQVYQLGSRGPGVEQLQHDLGIPADGVFGYGTKAAVQRFQSSVGLNPDGVWGVETQQVHDFLWRVSAQAEQAGWEQQSYLHTLAAQHEALNAYLYGLNGQQAESEQAAGAAYLHTLAAQEAAFNASMIGLALR
jgi:GH25 family lysozyme M1 (1,4-beta-N-acetylmuramidase)